MTHLVSIAVLSAALCSTATAAPVPVAPPDPLPKGATARLGSLAFRGPTGRPACGTQPMEEPVRGTARR